MGVYIHVFLKSTLVGLGLRLLGRPASSHSLYRLCYAGSSRPACSHSLYRLRYAGSSRPACSHSLYRLRYAGSSRPARSQSLYRLRYAGSSRPTCSHSLYRLRYPSSSVTNLRTSNLVWIQPAMKESRSWFLCKDNKISGPIDIRNFSISRDYWHLKKFIPSINCLLALLMSTIHSLYFEIRISKLLSIILRYSLP
jgi:hypothetical protein